MGVFGKGGGSGPRREARFGLNHRMAIASAALAVLTALTFALLYGTITHLRDTTDFAGRSEMLLASANRLERLIVDMEAGQRGYTLTGDDRYLQPWRAALAQYPGEIDRFARTTTNEAMPTRRQIPGIVRAADAYVWGYSVPLVAKQRSNPAAGRDTRTISLGKQRVDDLRHRFSALTKSVREQSVTARARTLHAARQATLTAVGAALAALLLIVTFVAYLSRSMVRPIRRVAVMAGGLSGGDMEVRMAETSPAEIGALERAFNSMARSLQQSHRELRRTASEQTALRRVATLVARGVRLQEIFATATAELGRILDADLVVICRAEPDGARTVAGRWVRPGTPGPVPERGDRLPPDDAAPDAPGLAAGKAVRRTATGTAAPDARTDARTDAAIAPDARPDAGPAPGGPAGHTGAPGARPHAGTAPGGRTDSAPVPDGRPESAVAPGATAGCAVAGPIIVGGGQWGTICCRSRRPIANGAEARLSDLAGLVGTAIANEETRSALVAARARLVAASDETRRRIERDLHDGVQQRIVSLGLELRAAEAAVPPDRPALGERIASVGHGLLGVLEDLREISRGLHPVVLSRAGLEPALRAVARRSPIPVELDVRTGRLDGAVEAAVYYVVSEAVTNAIKHARASCVGVTLCADGAGVRLSVRDDGAGGADMAAGSGLIGLKDRVESLGGTFGVHSPPGGGTHITAHIPTDP